MVSVVIPIRNGPAKIDACLRSIGRLNFPRDRLEVIVVDDASNDNTAEQAESHRRALPLDVVRSTPHRGPAAARNVGANRARGAVLAFVDGDCEVDADWLNDLVPAFDDAAVVAAGGAVVSTEERTWIQRYEAACHPSARGRTASDVHPGASNDFLPGCNMLVRSTAFRAAGGFDDSMTLGEDVDLVWRLSDAGGRVVYRPGGTVAHGHLDRLWPLLRRRIVYASSEAILQRRHPQARRRIVVPLPLLASAAWIVGSMGGGRPGLVPIAAAPLVADVLIARRRSRRRERKPSRGRLAVALGKAYASVLYRIVSLITRYYAVPFAAAGVLIGVFWRPALWTPVALLAAYLAQAIVEWIRLRPRLGAVAFVTLKVLDQIAIHLGILTGCVRHRTTLPLRLIFSITPTTLDLVQRGHRGAWLETDELFSPSSPA